MYTKPTKFCHRQSYRLSGLLCSLLNYILCVSIPLIVQNIFYKDAINGQDFLFVEITIIGSHMIKTSELHLQTAGSDFGAASQTFQQD